jgi:hypothetical protein
MSRDYQLDAHKQRLFAFKWRDVMVGRLSSILLSFVYSMLPFGMAVGATVTAPITCNIVPPTVSVSVGGVVVLHDAAKQDFNPADTSIVLTTSNSDKPVEFSIDNGRRLSYSLSLSSSVKLSGKTSKSVTIDNFHLLDKNDELTGGGTRKLNMGSVPVKDKTADEPVADIDADRVCITVNFN